MNAPSIDKLEAQLIDGPDALTPEQLKKNSLDETFQQKLNERASQLFGETWDKDSGATAAARFLVTRNVLEYKHSEIGEMSEVLALWFTQSDYDILDRLRLVVSDGSWSALRGDVDCGSTILGLDSAVYFCMGCFSDHAPAEQIQNILANCDKFIRAGIHEHVITLVIHMMETFPKSASPVWVGNFFKLLTVLYFLANSTVEALSKDAEALRSQNPLVLRIDSSRLLGAILGFLEKTELWATPQTRSRNLLMLVWRLLLLQFGGFDTLKKVDLYLCRHLQTRPKPAGLTCLVVDFITHKENLQDKYPLLAETRTRHMRENYMALATHLRSLLNLLEAPSTNKAHKMMNNLPIQTIHIATPAPSPPLTPSDFMSGGEKIRKLYHVNQAVPHIHPVCDDRQVPRAIEEADDLLEDASYESYSSHRLWREREHFMAQERGVHDQYAQSEVDSEAEILAASSEEACTLRRLETFYASAVVHLKAFVRLNVSVMTSNKQTLRLLNIEREFGPASFSTKYGTNTDSLVRLMLLYQLEILRVKEIALQAASSILALLLEWFKVSHVLKMHFLSSLLFDHQFLTEFVDFLSCSLNNPDLQSGSDDNKVKFSAYDVLACQNKLMNPQIYIPQFDYYNWCHNSLQSFQPTELINRNPFSMFPSSVGENNETVLHINQFNHRFCHILVNLFHVVNKVLVRNVSQRIFTFNDAKPTDLLKLVLTNYENDCFKIPILKIFKKLTPYQGRKWRALNMDVISLIYLNLRLSLNDNWISGKDIESDFNNSLDQEVALRLLLQFYHMRRYPEQMASLGYEIMASTDPKYDLNDLWN